VKIAVLFDNFGPYHLARLRAASQVCTLLALQVRRRSREYLWEPAALSEAFEVQTLERPDDLVSSPGQHPLILRLTTALVSFAPDCVFVPGWSSRCSLAALHWCAQSKIPSVIMSESTRADLPRRPWKEWLKSLLLKMCSAALVGGAPHTEYLTSLGMASHRIFPGYDVIDNDYFIRRTEEIRARSEEFRKQFLVPGHYFLASARFIKSKNLCWLIGAYALYRRAHRSLPCAHSRSAQTEPRSLVVLGDGAGRPELEKQIADLNLERCVLLPGFKQYAELPIYYALADAFVHASTSEPWGLVVNEAMASALPVLVSDRCGCSGDLVRQGSNGFTFDPTNAHSLVTLLLRLSNSQPECRRLGAAGRRLISAWGPARFQQGFHRAAEVALNHLPVCRGFAPSIFLRGLLQT